MENLSSEVCEEIQPQQACSDPEAAQWTLCSQQL